MAAGGLYAADGSWRITIVDGTDLTGIYAADGSMYAVEADGTVVTGANHPSRARWIFDNTNGSFQGRYHPCGAWLVTTDGTDNNDSIFITVVSGSLGSGPGGLGFGILMEGGVNFVLMEDNTDFVLMEHA